MLLLPEQRRRYDVGDTPAMERGKDTGGVWFGDTVLRKCHVECQRCGVRVHVV